jgi:hypothetical protein
MQIPEQHFKSIYEIIQNIKDATFAQVNRRVIWRIKY